MLETKYQEFETICGWEPAVLATTLPYSDPQPCYGNIFNVQLWQVFTLQYTRAHSPLIRVKYCFVTEFGSDCCWSCALTRRVFINQSYSRSHQHMMSVPYNITDVFRTQKTFPKALLVSHCNSVNLVCQWCPDIPPNSVIVMDTDPYHSVKVESADERKLETGYGRPPCSSCSCSGPNMG